MYYNIFFEWRQKMNEVMLDVRDEILITSSVPHAVWDRIFALYILCTFSGLQKAARELLTAYFDVESGLELYPRSPEKKILWLIWS